MLPFLYSQEAWTNIFLKHKFICKEAIGALFRIGCIELKALVKHVVHQMLPIHRLTNKIWLVITKF